MEPTRLPPVAPGWVVVALLGAAWAAALGAWFVLPFYRALGVSAAVLLGAAAAVFIIGAWCSRGRRWPRGYCPRCGYDLRGTPSPACPECGAEVGR